MVSDNGRGMQKENSSKSYGLRGMTERVRQLGGRITFGSPPGGGFCLAVILPLSAEEWSI